MYPLNLRRIETIICQLLYVSFDKLYYSIAWMKINDGAVHFPNIVSNNLHLLNVCLEHLKVDRFTFLNFQKKPT